MGTVTVFDGRDLEECLWFLISGKETSGNHKDSIE